MEDKMKSYSDAHAISIIKTSEKPVLYIYLPSHKLSTYTYSLFETSVTFYHGIDFRCECLYVPLISIPDASSSPWSRPGLSLF